MKKFTVISGDLVGYTGLSAAGRARIEQEIKVFLATWTDEFIFFSRLIKGDYLEIVCSEPGAALRLAIMLKCKIKSTELQKDDISDNQRTKYFQEYGIRLAIGYGPLAGLDIENGRIDGEAIFMSGRQINSQKTFDKERIVIKNTLFFQSEDPEINQNWKVILDLLDFMLANATARQCQIILHKLGGKSEQEISSLLEISQPAVNRHSTRAGWNAIETAVLYFESQIT